MNYYALIYDVVDDYSQLRQPFRELHLAAATAAVDRGELILGGAYADPVDGALLIFRAVDRSIVEAFAINDPYVLSGLVKTWTIREWKVVVGANYIAAA